MSSNAVSAAKALEAVQSGQRMFVQGSAATPVFLLQALAERAAALRKVEITSISMLGDIRISDEAYADSFYFNSLFVSDNIRNAVAAGQGHYIPVFLSEISLLFKRGILPLDIALIQVSPPDRHGFCSLGVSVDIALSAVKAARHVIAQVNPRMPRTHGDGLIHLSKIDILVEAETTLPEVNYRQYISPAEQQIARYCAALIEDGSTLQAGIGTIPDAVFQELIHHQGLGIHTEMFSDGVIDLIERGVVTNQYKRKHKGKVATSFCMGTRRLYDFIDDNPLFTFLESEYVNDAYVIAQNPKVVAINSAIEIDITGQICADSIGIRQYSGVGGQLDFIKGAALSEGGKPIIAMTATTKDGSSKIVPFLKEGAGVVTTRAHTHYVVTEFGVADLFGKNLKQRALALIDIAHPNHREWLSKEVYERFK
jgi:acyl-CoA hydrolase